MDRQGLVRKPQSRTNVLGWLSHLNRYTLTPLIALAHCCDHELIEIDSDSAERAPRVVVPGREKCLLTGSDAGGDRAAALYSRIGSGKLNGLDA